MELTQLNTVNTATNITSVNSAVKTDDIQNNKNIEKQYPEDIIEVAQNAKPSALRENISSNISKLANLQQTQSAISTQIEITTEIVKTTNSASNSSSVQLDDKQPSIKQYMDDFNVLSEGFSRPEISDEVGIYFDGKIGSKPLSSGEILDATAQQQERLHKYKEVVSNEIDAVVSQTKDVIESEKTTVETKIEFKTVDYAQASQQFDTSSLENLEGDFLPSQANAFPLHSEKLLA